jgi:hypothetical protein
MDKVFFGILLDKHMVAAEEALDDVNICSSAVNQSDGRTEIRGLDFS